MASATVTIETSGDWRLDGDCLVSPMTVNGVRNNLRVPVADLIEQGWFEREDGTTATRDDLPEILALFESPEFARALAGVR